MTPISPNRIIGDEMISLVLGPTVPVTVLKFIWDLEERGISLRVGDDGAVYAQPKELLSPSDVETIRVHVDDVVALIEYCESPPSVRQ